MSILLPCRVHQIETPAIQGEKRRGIEDEILFLVPEPICGFCSTLKERNERIFFYLLSALFLGAEKKLNRGM